MCDGWRMEGVGWGLFVDSGAFGVCLCVSAARKSGVISVRCCIRGLRAADSLHLFVLLLVFLFFAFLFFVSL